MTTIDISRGKAARQDVKRREGRKAIWNVKRHCYKKSIGALEKIFFYYQEKKLYRVWSESEKENWRILC